MSEISNATRVAPSGVSDITATSVTKRKMIFGKRTEIILSRDDKQTAVYAKEVTNADHPKVQEKLAKGNYVLLKVEIDGQQKTYLVKTDNIRKSFFSKTDHFAFRERLNSEDVVAFLRQKAVNATISRTSDPVASPSKTESADTEKSSVDLIFDSLEEDAKIGKTESVGISREEGKAIVDFVADFKGGKKIKIGGKEIEYKEGENYQIPRNATDPQLKCSLIVNKDGSVLVLLKTGKEGIFSCFRKKGKGSFKTVKRALNLTTGEVVAHNVLNITLQAHKQIAKEQEKEQKVRNDPDFKFTAAEWDQKLQAYEKELIEEAYTECRTQTTNSENPGMQIKDGDIITYKGKDGLTRVAFPTALGEGDLADNGRMEKVVSNPKVLKASLLNLSGGMAKMHKKGYIYQDAKIDNFMLMAKKVKGKLVYFVERIDFGYCREKSKATHIEGTPTTLAPEVLSPGINGSNSNDRAKADVWSEGCAYLELLVGLNTGSTYNDTACDMMDQKRTRTTLQQAHLASQDDANAALLGAGYSKELSEIISSMLTANPDERPSIDQVNTQLAALPEEKYRRRRV